MFSRSRFFPALMAIAAGLFCVSSPAPAADRTRALDGVAAVVNKEVITFSQVLELTARQEMMMHQALRGPVLEEKIKEIRAAAIQALVDRELVLQYCREKKLSFPEYVLDDQINSIVREQFGGNRAGLVKALQAQGMTLQRFRKLEGEKMLVQAARQQKSRNITPLVSPEKITRYYQAHIADYSAPVQLKLRMIVLSRENAKELAQDLAKRIKNGEEFAAMARRYSDDSTAENGGDWGWIEKGTLNESLARPAFALKPKTVGKPLSIGKTWYLLYVEERKGGEVKSLESVRAEVEQKALMEERIAAQEKWLKTLREKAYIKIF